MSGLNIVSRYMMSFVPRVLGSNLKKYLATAFQPRSKVLRGHHLFVVYT